MAGLIDLDGTPLGNNWGQEDEVDGLYRDTMDFINTRGMYPTKVIFFVTGCYRDMVRRSFNTNVTDESMNRLGNFIEQSSGQSVDLIGLSSIANDIITPSVTIDKEINIVNGWSEPRCRFFLEFKKPNTMDDGSGISSYTTYVYTGFTDYVGISESGHVDEDMELHVTAMSIIHNESRGYGRRQARVVSDRNIIVNDYYYGGDRTISGKNNARGSQEWLMDPGNVVLLKHSHDSFMDTSITGGKLHPASARASRTIKGVNRSYNIPSHYLSKLINVHSSVTDTADIYDDDEYGLSSGRSKLTRMHSMLRIHDMDTDPLTSLYREDGFISSATLRYHQLKEYFPNIDHHSVLKLIFPAGLRGGRSDNLHSRLRDIGSDTYDSEDWRVSDVNTIAATMIAQQLPNLMISEFIQSIQFSVHSSANNAFGESYHWVFGDDRRSSRDNRSAIMFLTELPNTYQQQRIEALKTKIEEVILNVITHSGIIGIDLMVDCDLLSDITIYISLDGGAEYKFVMPTFADSMTTSMLTTDTDHYTTFSTELVGLVDSVMG